jgi:hypothetical protein
VSKFSILRDVLALTDISAQQKLVLLSMNQFGDDGRNVYPAIETIAKLASLSPRQTKRHIRALRDKGYLSPQGKSRRNTVTYFMTVPKTANVPRPGTPATPPEGHQRPTTTLNKIPSNNYPKLRDSYFDSSSPGGQFLVDDLSRLDSAGAVDRMAARRKRTYGR